MRQEIRSRGLQRLSRYGIDELLLRIRPTDVGKVGVQCCMQIQITTRNWRKFEPGDDTKSEPARLSFRAATFICDTERMNLSQFALSTRLPLSFVAKAMGVDETELAPAVPKNVLQFRVKP